jgi:hypothetical protein
MIESSSQSGPQKWFLWGMVLACSSSLPFVILFLNAFRGISQDKAIGLGAVAGGLTEVYMTFGLVLTFLLPVAAIALLGRSFSGASRRRKLFSALFIVWSSFTLLLSCLSAWVLFAELPRLVNGPR